MCGRYTLTDTQNLQVRFEISGSSETAIEPRFNVAPSQAVPVVVERDGTRALELMHWGFRPSWLKGTGKRQPPINARAETLLEKPMFRGLTKAKRCIVPASGFYEWRKVDGRKQPFYLTSEDGEAWGFAGLYDLTHEDENDAAGSFTIITTAANSLVAPLHERMPAILRREDEEEWVSRDVTDPIQVERLLQPYPEDAMRVYAVSADVNSPRNNGPELIEPDEGDR